MFDSRHRYASNERLSASEADEAGRPWSFNDIHYGPQGRECSSAGTRAGCSGMFVQAVQRHSSAYGPGSCDQKELNRGAISDHYGDVECFPLVIRVALWSRVVCRRSDRSCSWWTTMFLSANP